MKKSYIILITAFLLLIFSACTKQAGNQTGKDTASSKNSVSKVQDPAVEAVFGNVNPSEADNALLAPVEFRVSLNDMFTEYIHLKQALANSDSVEAIMQTNQLKKSMANVKPGILDEPMKKNWDAMNVKIEECCKGITSSENIEKQRKKFSEITGIITELVKKFGLKNRTIYVLNCPDVKSGMWLSDTKDIGNPYLGGKKCAELKEALKFN
jgi:hypothetical protein